MLIILSVMHVLFLFFYLIKVDRRQKEGVFVFIVSIFSVGYYILPLVFLRDSGLDKYSVQEVFDSALIHIIYFWVLLGTYDFCKNRLRFDIEFTFPLLERKLEGSPYIGYYFLAGGYLVYLMTTNTTVYSAGSIEEALSGVGAFTAVLSLVSGIFLSLSIYMLVDEIQKNGINVGSLFMLIPMFMIIYLIANNSQRAMILTPFIYSIFFLSMLGRDEASRRLLVVSLLVIVISSPVMVYMRTTVQSDSVSAYQEYYKNSNQSLIESSFESIIKRSDLIENTIHLKRHIDRNPNEIGGRYYLSVLTRMFPSFLVGSKDYSLSSNGKRSGEISNLAWSIRVGNDSGSLTAFGGVVAYRQGGWFVLILDAILGGVFLVFLKKIFINGSVVSLAVYATLANFIFMKNAPASFMQILNFSFPLLVIVTLFYLLDRFLSSNR